MAAVAQADGTATFKFQSPPEGLTWTGTMTCAGAPLGAVFAAVIGAVSWGDWAGNSVYGPVQALANQQLIITATGLVPGTSYEIVWAGSSDDSRNVQPVWPDANDSAIVASSVTAPPGLILPATSEAVSGGTASATFSVPSTTRTLVVKLLPNSFATQPPISVVQVIGQQSGLDYYNGQNYLAEGGSHGPYLQAASSPFSYLVVVPVCPAVDTSYTVTCTVPGAVTSVAIQVSGDSLEYQENIFYNGVVKSNALGATGTLATGPIRLLTIGAASGQAVLINGSVMINGGSVADPGVTMPFPPNTILGAGGTVTCVAGGAVTYAYP